MSISRNEPILSPDYKPSEEEPYMNEIMLAHFKQKLIEWRESLLAETGRIQQDIADHTERNADYVDRGVIEENREPEFFLLDRDMKLIQQIDMALDKIIDKSYGYSEISGEPIGVARLEAWPVATLTVEEQEKREQLESHENSHRNRLPT
jgi:DnaK suppressor protein